jgi:hypothetical protein
VFAYSGIGKKVSHSILMLVRKVWT